MLRKEHPIMVIAICLPTCLAVWDTPRILRYPETSKKINIKISKNTVNKNVFLSTQYDIFEKTVNIATRTPWVESLLHNLLTVSSVAARLALA
jgi:hypothetical protein